jgi:2,4-dienoyl-CoA reductase (NADPH2)
VDSVVLCTGQESVRDLAVAGPARRAHVIGVAALAAELDAERAIRQGATVAARL